MIGGQALVDGHGKAQWAGLVALLMGLAGSLTAAQAQTAAPSRACQQQCASQVPATAGQRNMQVCLVRCAAGEAYLARQRRPGSVEASGQGVRPGTAPVATRRARSLVVYAGALPLTGLSVSRPMERTAAHRAAETDCYRRNGQRPCRLLTETEQRCVAVARGLRARGLVVTDDPGTFILLHYGVGGGQDVASARDMAMQDCLARLAPGDSCRPLTSRCGPN
ncbi:DUF4189 domain-containing protein [Roseomonas sp. F4]